MLHELILNDIQDYIENHLSMQKMYSPKEIDEHEIILQSEQMFTMDMEDFINKHRQPTLNQMLFRLIDKSGQSDVDIYKKAGIDRKLFSKIRKPDYQPGKNTTLALALALQLGKEETDDLLSSAGYSLSDSNIFDLVIQYCLENRIHDMDTVNEALFQFTQKTL